MKNPQDSTRGVQGQRDRGQDTKVKDLAAQVKQLERQLERQAKEFRQLAKKLGAKLKPEPLPKEPAKVILEGETILGE